MTALLHLTIHWLQAVCQGLILLEDQLQQVHVQLQAVSADMEAMVPLHSYTCSSAHGNCCSCNRCQRHMPSTSTNEVVAAQVCSAFAFNSCAILQPPNKCILRVAW